MEIAYQYFVKFVVVVFLLWLHKCIIAINLRPKGDEKGQVGQFLVLAGIIAINRMLPEDC